MARLRAASQLLHRPASGTDPVEVLREIGGSQSQEPRPGRLQVRARSKGLTADAVESARVDDRSIVRHWVMRMTAHLFPADDFGWITPIFTERMAGWSRRRLELLNVTASERDKALKAIAKTLDRDGSITRARAMEAAEKTGLEIDVQRRTHLAVLTVLEVGACIGPSEGRDNYFVKTEDWLGKVDYSDREDGLAELARRYFAAFAPAGEADFAFWAGLPLRDCRAGMQRIAGELDQHGTGDAAMFAPKGATLRMPRSPVVRLLGAYDTYMMGYASRRHAVDAAGEKVILPGGGVLRPVICVDGKFVGTWASKKSGKTLKVTLEPFDGLDDAWTDALEAEVVDIGRFENVEARLA